jgi:Holliday junction DNA helicase RuvB
MPTVQQRSPRVRAALPASLTDSSPVRDFAEVIHSGTIDLQVANDALDRLEVDRYGLDEVDRKILLTIIEKFNGGPVGIGTISAAIHEEKEAIEEMYEPYLIQIGFLNRTPRGRVVTPSAYQHLIGI